MIDDCSGAQAPPMIWLKQLPFRPELISPNALPCSPTTRIPPYNHAAYGYWFANCQKDSSAPGNIQSSSSRKPIYVPWAIAAPLFRAKLRSDLWVLIIRTHGEACQSSFRSGFPESLTTITSNSACWKFCSRTLFTATCRLERPIVGMI